jgi:hypothetical protein
VRRLAASEGIALPVERGLRFGVAESNHGTPIKLRRASVNGKGLKAGLCADPRNILGALAYGRNGE